MGWILLWIALCAGAIASAAMLIESNATRQGASDRRAIAEQYIMQLEASTPDPMGHYE